MNYWLVWKADFKGNKSLDNFNNNDNDNDDDSDSYSDSDSDNDNDRDNDYGNDNQPYLVRVTLNSKPYKPVALKSGSNDIRSVSSRCCGTIIVTVFF